MVTATDYINAQSTWLNSALLQDCNKLRPLCEKQTTCLYVCKHARMSDITIPISFRTTFSCNDFKFPNNTVQYTHSTNDYIYASVGGAPEAYCSVCSWAEPDFRYLRSRAPPN